MRGGRLVGLVAVAFLALLGREAAALCGNQIRDPGEECDATAIGGDSLCERACIPAGMPGECTCARPSTSPVGYAVIADEMARVGTGVAVVAGDVGVLNTGGRLVVGKLSILPAGNNVVGDRVRLLPDSRVGRLFSNAETIKTGAVVQDGGAYRFPTPLVLSPALPPFGTATPGSTPVNVLPGATVTLAPGAYGEVLVNTAGTLVLSGLDPGSGKGSYDFASLSVLFQATVQANHPVVIRIADRLAVLPRAVLGPAPSADAIAGDIDLEVAGLTARVSHLGSVRAHIRATRLIAVGRSASITGRLVAPRVKVGAGVEMRGEGGCGDGVLDPNEACDTSAPGGGAACTVLPCIPPGQPGQCRCQCATNADCDDGNPCTTDTCLAIVGCQHVALPNGTPCGVGVTCNSGICQ